MTQVIKIERDGKTAEVVEQYVGDFIRDGWKRVSERTEELSHQERSEKANKEVREKAEHAAALELKAAEDEKARQEEAQAKIERDKQALDLKHAQEALNHSRIGVDHAAAIIELKDKEEVERYVKDNFNKDLDKRGSLESVKEKALLISKEVH